MADSEISVECPCCGARLVIDRGLGSVIAHSPAPKQSKIADLDRANELLREQAARREALFKKSTEDEKQKSWLLEKKFEAGLKQTKDSPVVKPTRDIDLD